MTKKYITLILLSFLPTALLLSAENFFNSNSHYASFQNRSNFNLDQYANKVLFSNLFIKAITDKNEYFLGEPIVVDYLLYVNDKIILTEIIEQKTPVFENALSEEVDIGKLKYEYETIGQDLFRKALLRKFVISPTEAGTYTIPVFSLKINALLEFSPDYPTDEKYFTKTNTYSSQPLSINIVEIQPIQNFSGAVGNFSLKNIINVDSLQLGESFEYTLELSGTGNFYLIKAPKLALPAGLIQTNEPQIIDSLKIDSSISGKRIFIYNIKSLKSGLLQIPEQVFTFFEPTTRQFFTLKTQAHNLFVLGSASVEIEQKSFDTNIVFQYFSYAAIAVILIFLIIYIAKRITSGDFSKHQVPREDASQSKADFDFQEFQFQDKNELLDYIYKSIVELLVRKINLPKNQISTEKIVSQMKLFNYSQYEIDKVVEFLNLLKELRFFKKEENIDVNFLKNKTFEFISIIDKKSNF